LAKLWLSLELALTKGKQKPAKNSGFNAEYLNLKVFELEHINLISGQMLIYHEREGFYLHILLFLWMIDCIGWPGRVGRIVGQLPYFWREDNL